jgi:hypothetical protein
VHGGYFYYLLLALAILKVAFLVRQAAVCVLAMSGGSAHMSSLLG